MKANELVEIDIYEKKTPEDFIKFLHKLHVTPEQLKSGDLEHIAGLATDTKTGNIVVPPALLKEQGELLHSLITSYSDHDEKSQDLHKKLDIENLKKILSDAAFKVVDEGGNSIVHRVAMRAKNHLQNRVINSETLFPLIEKATPDQLALKNKVGDDLLSIVLRYNHKTSENDRPSTYGDDDLKEKHYRDIKKIVGMLSDETLSEHQDRLKKEFKSDGIIDREIEERWEKANLEEVAKRQAEKRAAEEARKATAATSLKNARGTITSLLPTRKDVGWADSVENLVGTSKTR